MRFVFCLFLLLAGCSTDMYYRMYNSDDLQDPECYAKFGGQWGYCDQHYERHSK